MKKFAIVVIGYNRAECMLRLLDSLNAAHIRENVPLIISLDNCGSDVVKKAVEDFQWKHGSKQVVTYPRRLGLKKHVLSVGRWTQQYENIVVFEDDLFVSPYFFDFVKAAVDAYGEDDRIAGIGLYNQNLNQQTGYYFEPIDDGADVYFMQYACSWGQVWTQKKWQAFMNWYADHAEPFTADSKVPKNVNRWNEKSWLKYHVRYCAYTQRYFVYPRISLTTNFSSAGSHARFNDNAYQIALQCGPREWSMPSLEQSRACYDVFYENLYLADTLGVDARQLCVDTYGVRKNSGGKRYWLTTRAADYKVLRSFALDLRPREANVVFGIDGDVIKLYDTACTEKGIALSAKQIDDIEMHYIARAVSIKKMLAYCLRTVIARLRKKC